MLIPLIVLGTLSAQDPRSTLLATDRLLAETVTGVGLEKALAGALADQAVLVHPGAPVLQGRSVILAAIAGDPILDSLTVAWDARDAWLSSDSGFGVTAGLTRVTPLTGGPRTGSYIAAWRRQGSAWRLVGLMQTGLVPGARTRYDPAWGPKELAPRAPVGPAADLVRADLDFAALAGREGAPAAFRAYAAPNGFTYAGGGRWNEGPDAIGAAVGRGGPAHWSWYPVAAQVAGSGDLGFTVGQAVITPDGGGDPIVSKYLTIWVRQPDGRMKFLTDGGNPRPRP